jgi:misacylated tRNA(Ala) deacylase
MNGPVPPTTRLYWQDDHCVEADARVVAVRGGALAFDRTCFYPGGGGQPPDEGTARLASGAVLAISSARADGDDVVWHTAAAGLPADLVGQPVALAVDRDRRSRLARHHTVLHVLNTIALRDHGGWITGVQIGTDYSRIDFALAELSPALCGELERKVNAVLRDDRALRASWMPEAEFRARGDLLRTLEARPPVSGGRIRVVEIASFDAQACGGTHVANTGEVGRFSIVRTENKGRLNKRLYISLDRPE